MNLCLSTIDVWILDGAFSPSSLLRQLGMHLQHGDIIAVGAYNPSQRFCAAAAGLRATAGDASTIYDVFFDHNRDEHPNGRSFEFPMNEAVLAALIAEAQRPDGQDDKPLFFDHLVAYRRGTPAVPLLCFHDAFHGGNLALSGLYSEASVRAFAEGLPSIFARQRNPENYPIG